MISAKKFLTSTLGQKFIMALTGLALVGFVIMHLLGNLTLYLPKGESFNAYAAKLESLGALLQLAEVGLVGFFVIHIFMAIQLTLKNRASRGQAYGQWRSKATSVKVTDRGGGEDSAGQHPEAQPSFWGSRNMIVSGLILFGFLILHIWQFKYGPAIEQGYTAIVHEQSVRDLHRLVVETFKNPFYTLLYMGVMLFLGLHLHHGFWSAFQSLGMMTPRYTRQIHCLGWLIAVVVAAGFFFIPLWIYFGVPLPTLPASLNGGIQ